MAAMDHINQAMGRRTLFCASAGIQQGWARALAPLPSLILRMEAGAADVSSRWYGMVPH